MQLQQLNSFLVLSRTLNFTHAAENLYIAQSSLSAQIAALEQELGCQLFTRTTRSVRLTPAGECLARRAKEILDEVDRLPAELKKSQEGENGVINVSYSDGTLPYFVPAIRRLSVSHPGIQVIPHHATEISKMLSPENSYLDATLLAAPCINGMDWVTAIPLKKSGLSLMVSAAHPLAGRKEVSIREIANNRLLLFPRPQIPRLYDFYISALRAYQVSCQLVTAPDADAVMALAAAGMGVTFSPDYKALDSSYGLVKIPIMECRYGYDLVFVYPSDNNNPSMKYLKQAILDD